MNINKKKSTKSVLKYLITYILGIITILISQFISNYFNRPIINIYFESIIIREYHEDKWETEIKLKFVNSGNSSTTIEVKDVLLYFPLYSQRPYSLEINDYIKIDEKSTLVKSINTMFPSIFDSVTYNFPKLSKVELEYKMIETQKYELVSIDSNYIKYSFGYSTEYYGPEKLTKSIIDTSEQKISLKVKPFYIEYGGNSYINKIYPPNALVKYKIQDDKIFLEYSLPIESFLSEKQSQLIEPFIFFPHPELKGKIVNPNKSTLRFFVENRKSTEISYSEYVIETHESENIIIYIFK